MTPGLPSAHHESSTPPPVRAERRGDLAVLLIDNPPVNALDGGVRAALRDALLAATADSAVRAIILAGCGPHFSAGADLREIGRPPRPDAPLLPEILEAVEQARVPVVAVLHGTTAGGALELALACHERIVAADARLALPEVGLGFTPGAGGTQRLPRVIGLDAALDMILTSRQIGADEAAASGLADAIAAGDPLEFAAGRALRLAGAAPRRTCDLPAPPADPHVREKYERWIEREARGRQAPRAALDCVWAGLQLPFRDGLRLERETFLALVGAPEARALRHVFLAERFAAKVDAVDGAPVRPISAAGVVGFGTMGRGIAIAFANAGIPVCVIDQDSRAVENGLAQVRSFYASAATKGRLTREDAEERASRITGAGDYAALAHADVVVEAAFEEMEVKLAVMAQLDAVCSPAAILATNTSSLDVAVIAAASRHPERVIGMHFFSPANVMRLVEVVRPPAASASTVATTLALARSLGKIPVVVGVCDGFVGNRMLFAYRQQADFLLEEGALPEQVDRALTAFGMAMGPYQAGDLAGLDISWRIRQRKASSRPPHLRYSRIADMLCERGRFGQKTGAGWYRYEPGSRTPVPDPDVAALIETVSREAGITRRPVDDTEIVDRCLGALVNEGARILEEGVARCAGDIDVIWIHGYGFPRHRGGPMFWASTVGFSRIAEVVTRLHAAQGELVQPSTLLRSLAAAGAREWPR